MLQVRPVPVASTNAKVITEDSAELGLTTRSAIVRHLFLGRARFHEEQDRLLETNFLRYNGHRRLQLLEAQVQELLDIDGPFQQFFIAEFFSQGLELIEESAADPGHQQMLRSVEDGKPVQGNPAGSDSDETEQEENELFDSVLPIWASNDTPLGPSSGCTGPSGPSPCPKPMDGRHWHSERYCEPNISECREAQTDQRQ